jgi:hypothetical protein
MRLALSQRKDIIKKTNLCQFCYEQKKGSGCLSASEREGHFCKDSGNPSRHASATHQNHIQVHHLGFRWAVNSAGELKSRSGTVKAPKSVKMAERLLSPSDFIRRLMDADSASEDKYTLKLEVMDLVPSDSESDLDSEPDTEQSSV